MALETTKPLSPEKEISTLLDLVEECKVTWTTKVLAIVIPFIGWIVGGLYWACQSELYEKSLSTLKERVSQLSSKEKTELHFQIGNALARHGVFLSTVSTENLDRKYLAHLKKLKPFNDQMKEIFGDAWGDYEFRWKIFPIYLRMAFTLLEPTFSNLQEETLFQVISSPDFLQSHLTLDNSYCIELPLIKKLQSWLTSQNQPINREFEQIMLDRLNINPKNLWYGSFSQIILSTLITIADVLKNNPSLGKNPHFVEICQIARTLSMDDDFCVATKIAAACLSENEDLFRQMLEKRKSAPPQSNKDFIKTLRLSFRSIDEIPELRPN